MKIENQVCTLEQAKKLKELLETGISSLWFWVYPKSNKMISSTYGIYYYTQALDIFNDNDDDEFDSEIAPAYSVAELGCILPDTYLNTAALHTDEHLKKYDYYFGFWKTQNQWSYRFEKYEPDIFFNTQAECYAHWLICLLENKLITADEVNKRLNESTNRREADATHSTKF